MHRPHPRTNVAIIGGGPAGLMAAEVLSLAGTPVDVYDAMPSVGRKFLMAGRGGLNLTHAEPREAFLSRFGLRRSEIESWISAFGPEALRQWARELGVETFVGTSNRVFPTEMKAAPLLRAWLHRLRQSGVLFHMRHRWLGWADDGGLLFVTPQGEQRLHADAVVLALGGGSWARLGSDGAWVKLLASRAVPVAPLRPANCGFDVAWSEHFRGRFAGHPVKSVTLSFRDARGELWQRAGEFVVSGEGVEGSLIYALSAPLRDLIEAKGGATVALDLAPNRTVAALSELLAKPRGSRSLSEQLRRRVGLDGVKAGLLRESLTAPDFVDPHRLAAAIKALPLQLAAPRPLDEAISSAGGVCFEGMDSALMLRTLPGVFCCGEMLDWEAPTGGYLLTACMASGRVAGHSVLEWLAQRQ